MFARLSQFYLKLVQATSAAALTQTLAALDSQNKTVGFVPTMGALHNGHLHLIKEAVKQCDLVVVSIFVNPNQFNNTEDFNRYPRTIDADLNLLQDLPIHVVYTPTVKDIYNEEYTTKYYELGLLDKVLEGLHRPGHFQGVATVVDILFSHVKPTIAFFGEKDLQQVAVIKQITKVYHPKVKIEVVETVRNSNGLALSSRNTLLSKEGITIAEQISSILFNAKSLAASTEPNTLIKQTREAFNELKGITLEYAEIIDSNSFKTVSHWEESQQAHLCIACFVENIRLIDNLRLK
ncbi:MAG: pantoate--beta-alanine ligase [Luteibaculaceae bacterium]